MKKIIMCALLLFILVGCKGKDNKNYKEDLISYSSEIKEYNLKAQMKVFKEEGETSFDVTVDYLGPNYYKVRLQNKNTNNIQVIVKNDDGVFVITPEMNKQFKFNSDWPLNSSHAYLYQSIIKDITNDNATTIMTEDDNYIIKSVVNNKTNAKHKTQKTTFNKKTHQPISNEILDAQEKPVVRVDFKEFNTAPKLKASDFNIEAINTSIRLELAEGEVNGVLTECVPTFIPTGYELDKSVIQEDYTVFKYKNEENIYTITCVVTEVSKVLAPSREFLDVVMLDDTLGFVNEKSISFFKDNLLVSIYNENFNLEEVVLIANSFN